MLLAHNSVHVAATPREVLEFVCDLQAYWTLDSKIAKVYDNPPLDADGAGHVVIQGSVRGIRSPRQRLSVKLDRWRSVTFESDGPWLTDRLMWMRGGFVVEPRRRGSLVTHSYRFSFKGFYGPLMERYLRDWLDNDLHDELQRIKGHFDRQAKGLPPLNVLHRRHDRTEEQRTRDRIKAWRSMPNPW